MSCLDTGGAKASLSAISKVETSFGIMMQISKFRFYQKSYKIVTSDDNYESKSVNNNHLDNLEPQGVNLHGRMIYFKFYTYGGLLCYVFKSNVPKQK